MVPLDELDPYVQDALDLIEFANGAATSNWGKVRAEMGHPAPFNLKMIAVGNEQWGKVYVERLEVFTKAIRAEISGYQGDWLVRSECSWGQVRLSVARNEAQVGVDLVDEHYYMKPEWFLEMLKRYDSYGRKGPKVFAGEYAAHD